MPLWRVCLWLPGQDDPSRHGHPAYVWPHQGRGRVDDPEHEYLVLYLGDSPAGAVAEFLGDYVRWTPATLDPPPSAPAGTRVALARYELTGRVLDLDDPEVLADRALRPSEVVTRERAVTQRWAREVYDAAEHVGVSWWSYRDPRWASLGVWSRDGVRFSGDVEPLTLDHAEVAEAAEVLRRVVVP